MQANTRSLGVGALIHQSRSGFDIVVAFSERHLHHNFGHRPRACGNALSLALLVSVSGTIVRYEVGTSKGLSGPHRLQQRGHPKDLHRPLHVVRQNLQTHFRSYIA